MSLFQMPLNGFASANQLPGLYLSGTLAVNHVNFTVTMSLF